MKKTKTISIKVDPDLKRRIKETADAQCRSEASLITWVLSKYLDSLEEPSQPSSPQ